MFIGKILTRVSVLVGAAGILAGCTVVVEEGSNRPRPPRPDRPQICTMEYKPVCARKSGERRTFSNACSARAAGFRVVNQGRCRPQSNRPDRPQICTREYRPVCARKGGQRRSFGNACSARAAGFRIVRPGRC